MIQLLPDEWTENIKWGISLTLFAVLLMVSSLILWRVLK
jgi:hypothetical protein